MNDACKREDLPDTIKRSSKKAQETYRKLWRRRTSSTTRGAGPSHGARRLKHSFEKVETSGWPRSRRAHQTIERPVAAAEAVSAGGVDVFGNTKEELYERAKKLGVEGRSKMNKLELAQAIARKQG